MKTREEYRRGQRLKGYVWLGIIGGLVILLIAVCVLRCNRQFIDSYDYQTLKPQQQMNVPLYNQYPELPNGCEVTSLSMLLNYYHVHVSKDQLASKIHHVSSYSDGGRYRGNPNVGFVGYMSQANGGWCVYNVPLENVASKYTNRVQNASGEDFIQIMKLVSDGHPVLIITTLSFNQVNDMQTWKTRQGPVHVTPSSHACVITGYNKAKKIIYVNDPHGVKNRPVPWAHLEASFNQQGKQALYMQ